MQNFPEKRDTEEEKENVNTSDLISLSSDNAETNLQTSKVKRFIYRNKKIFFFKIAKKHNSPLIPHKKIDVWRFFSYSKLAEKATCLINGCGGTISVSKNSPKNPNNHLLSKKHNFTESDINPPA